MAPPRPPPADLAAEMEQLRAQLAELHQQQTNAQTTNTVLEQLVQNLNTGKKSKIWVDKPERFNGKIGDSVENWLNGWELWFKHREKQDGPEEERTKIETAMQCTTATVRSALARHERENGQWTTWDSFQKYMKAKYTSTDSGFARYWKLKQVVQKDGERSSHIINASMSISVARRKTMKPKLKLWLTETRRSTVTTTTCSSITSMWQSSQVFFA